jgi:hypothetical protein
MSRWRVTHVGPTGRRHRVWVTARTTTHAQAQVLLALGEARAMACIRLLPTKQQLRHV